MRPTHPNVLISLMCRRYHPPAVTPGSIGVQVNTVRSSSAPPHGYGRLSYLEGRSRPLLRSWFTALRPSDRLRRMSWAGDLTSPDWSVAAMLDTGEAGLYSAIAEPSAAQRSSDAREKAGRWRWDVAKLKDIRIYRAVPRSSLSRTVNRQLTPVIKDVSRSRADLLRRRSEGVSGQTVQIS
jgi:hypothetical protein